MKVLLLLLALSASGLAAANDTAATQIKDAIARDWVARGDSGGVEVSSPSYPMPYQRGCVIHSLYFPTVATGPMPGHMVSQDRYFVFATDAACAGADPTQFFSIEPANDTVALLDFAKQLKDGPRAGTDKISDADRARIAPCFVPEALAGTRISRAHSWREKGTGRDDRYQVVLRCKAVDEAGEIIALGVRDQKAITWVFKPWGEITVDAPGKGR
ncbi:hypothetical protein [Arenimonas sp. GDDSR-1]|uniref:hypothetical protein n=1 Tax=Arenimonas sp. GDDSR-1 TaxID=2950125 RepID=UPI002630657A|nr:hypothetical protein [Arenimonas sp. GDDSR-1]